MADGSEVSCYAVMVATGMAVRKLEVPGLDSLVGAGVYYGAATTEAATYRDGEVCVVGGANSAGQGALYFSRYAEHVTMLIRSNSLKVSMSQYLIDRITSTSNIDVITKTVVSSVFGDGHLEKIELQNIGSQKSKLIDSNALFIFVGSAPRSEILHGIVEMDDKNFILTGPDIPRIDNRPISWKLSRDPFMFETSVPGVFAAGDVRSGANRRVAAAVGEGSAAIYDIHKYLETV
jgi:thioredoxin reductase (NADPH)